MTAPTGGGSNINLATMWVPIMPETSHMAEGGRKAGQELRRGVEEGFKSGGGLTQLGQTLGSQLSSGFKTGMGNLELPGGLTNLTEGLMRGFEGMATRSENAHAALERLKQSEEQLANSHNKVAVAQSRLNDLQQRGVTSGTQYLSASTNLANAKQREDSALRQVNGAHANYAQALSSSRGGMMAFAAETGILAGVIAGAIPLLGQITEGIIDFGKELVEKGVESVIEFGHQLMEIGEEYHSLGIQIQEFSTLSGESLEEMETAARQVFSSLDVAGNDTGAVMAMLSSRLKTTDAEALMPLTRHVEELRGRFHDLQPESVVTAFAALNVDIKDADNALASWLESARGAGVPTGALINSLAQVGESLRPEITHMSAEQIGEWVAEMSKVEPNVNRTVMALTGAQKLFSQKGLDFAAGMREAVKELEEAGTEAAKEDLAEKLFGTRKWPAALEMARQYAEVLAKPPAPPPPIDEFLKETQDLGNKWEEVKKKIEAALLPLGMELLSRVSGMMDNLNRYMTQHSADIARHVKDIGDAFIRFLPTLQQWTVDFLEFLKPVVMGVEEFGSRILDAIAGVALQMASAMDLMAEIPGVHLIPGFDAARKAAHAMGSGTEDAARKMREAVGPTGHFFDTLTDKVQGLHIDVPKLTDEFDKLSDSLGRKMGEAAGEGIDRVKLPDISGGLEHMASPGSPGGGTPPAVPSGADQQTVARYIFAAAKSRGYSDEDALAIVAYGIGESGLNPGISGGPQGAGGTAGGPADVVLGIFQEKPGFAQSGGIDPNTRNQLGPNVTAYLNQLSAKRGAGDILDQLLATSQGGPMYTGGRGAMVGLIDQARKLLGMQTGGEVEPVADPRQGMPASPFDTYTTFPMPGRGTRGQYEYPDMSPPRPILKWPGSHHVYQGPYTFQTGGEVGGFAAAWTPGNPNKPWWNPNAKREMDPGTNISAPDPRNKYGMWWPGPGETYHPGWGFDAPNNAPGWGGGTVPGMPGYHPGFRLLPDWWFGETTPNKPTYKAFGDMVTGGRGGIDDVPAWLTAGEFVVNKKATQLFGPLLRWINARGFQPGGQVPSDTGTGSANAYAANPNSNDTQGVDQEILGATYIANKLGLRLTAGKSGHGTHEDDGGWHDSGAAGDFSNGVQTPQELAFAQYMIANFASEMAEIIHDSPALPQLVKDGKMYPKSIYAKWLAGHRDHVHVAFRPGSSPRLEALAQSMGQSAIVQPGTSGAAASPLGFGGAGSGTGTPGGGFGGSVAPGGPSMGPPGTVAPPVGSPGTTAGYGPYGTESYDQWYQGNKAITGAQTRVDDLNRQITTKQQELDKANADLTKLQAQPELTRNDEQIASKTTERDRLQQELDKLRNQELPGATEEMTQAQRKAWEDAQKPAGGQQEYKIPGASEFTQLGGGLVKGMAQEFGLGDIFAKPPWEWGIVKLMSGMANWGLGTANAWAEEIGKGHTGMTGFQPIAGMEQSGSAGLEGVLKGFGLNVPMPQPQRVDRFGRPVGNASGANVLAGPVPGMPGSPGPGNGPVIQGDYMPINVSPNVNPSAILAPVQADRNAQEARLHTYTGGMPPP